METSHNLENPLKIFNHLDGITYKVSDLFETFLRFLIIIFFHVDGPINISRNI